MRKLTSSNAANDAQILAICPAHYALTLLSGRWKIALVWYVHTGLNRFGRLQQKMPGITTKMLSQQLRELERDGLLHRQVFAQVPPRVEYALTAVGRALLPLLEHLQAWGEQQQAHQAQASS
jgi:DNA-binding HxlR family transcriptional regulator